MVKTALLSLIAASSLFSADIMIFYKSGGAKAYDKLMASPTYWNDLLRAHDLRFGYFDKTVSLLACFKDKGTLELYAPDAQKRFSLKKRYPALTGKYQGDKATEGDHRTPIGIYTLTEKKNKVDPFYGPMAFVTSYPNLYDRIRGKNGHGIWIHGVPMNGTREAFTKGCIAINNTDLVNLDQNINPSKTLLIIDAKAKKSPETSAYSSILAALYGWKYAWTYNDLDSYLSFYDPSFKRYDGMGYEPFKLYKQRVFAKEETKTITFENITILPYPGERRNLFMVTFDEIYVSDNHRFEGEKSMLVSFNDDKTVSILTED